MIIKRAAYRFNNGSDGIDLLRAGWAAPDEHGVLSTGPTATIHVPAISPCSDCHMELTLDPLKWHTFTHHRIIRVHMNGTHIRSSRFGGIIRLRVPLPDGPAKPYELTLSAAEAGHIGTRGIRLTALDILQTKRAQIPQHIRPMTELRFGWNDHTEAWLGTGWGAPEDGYVWAIGGISILSLPLPPVDGPLFVLIDMSPYTSNYAPDAQRIAVSVDDRSDETIIVVSERITNAIKVPPQPGRKIIKLRFRNLDADFETRDPFFHYGKPYAWMLFSARVVPAFGGFLPGARPPLPGARSDGSMQLWVKGLTSLDARDIVGNFQTLGNGCDLGHLQRFFGKEIITLLRFSGALQSPLINGIFDGFRNIGRVDNIAISDRVAADNRWRLIDHAYLTEIQTSYDRSSALPDRAFEKAALFVSRLAERLMEDISLAQKIFMFRMVEKSGAEPAILAVLAALRQYGDAELLWIVSEGDMAPGMVERLPSGVLRGRIESGLDAGTEKAMDSLLSVLANAHVLLLQSQRLAP